MLCILVLIAFFPTNLRRVDSGRPRSGWPGGMRKECARRAAAAGVVALCFVVLLLERGDRRLASTAERLGGRDVASGVRSEKVAQLYREERDDAAEAQAAEDADRPLAAKKYVQAAKSAAAAAAHAASKAEVREVAQRLGRQDAEIKDIKKEIRAFQQQAGGVPGHEFAGGGGGGARRSEAEIAQAIGAAVIQHDPADRAKLAQALAAHKHTRLAGMLGVSRSQSESTVRSAFGLPVVTDADKEKLPGVNEDSWSDPRVNMARTYGAPLATEASSRVRQGDAWKLSNQQLRMVVAAIDRAAANERLEAGVIAGRQGKQPGYELGDPSCKHSHVCACNADGTPNPHAQGFTRATNNWNFFAGERGKSLRSGGRSDAPNAFHFTTGDRFRTDPSAQTRPDPLSNSPREAGGSAAGDAPALVTVNTNMLKADGTRGPRPSVKADAARVQSLFSVEGGEQLASGPSAEAVVEEVSCVCPRCIIGDERVGIG